MCDRLDRVETYIPKAMKSLQEHFPKNEIERKYSGYVASFGASLTQSGLIPTLAFYYNKPSDGGGEKKEKEKENRKKSSPVDRIKIMKILEEMLGIKESLLKYVINQEEDEELFQEKIKRAAVALKLAMRTFKLTDGGEGDE